MAVNILTLDPEEISRFLVRQRRDWVLELPAQRLDAFLTEILRKANEFVPSESGAILLDDPRAKAASDGVNTLTFIACFGGQAERLLGRQIPVDLGIAGQVYATGRPYLGQDVTTDPFLSEHDTANTEGATASLIAVPVVVGEAIFGVLELVSHGTRRTYGPGDLALLETFAGYISSSIQNALDAIRAREAARRDDLTGLFNDRYLHHRLGEEIPRAEQDGSHLSLIFLDLDHFKSINDRHGHLVGSRTLKELGYLLQHAAPPGGITARYGGDEFVIILPGYSAEAAQGAAEALRQRIRETNFAVVPMEGGERFVGLAAPLTASFGVASLNEHVAPQGTQLRRQNALIRLADQAMYDAKGSGRDRVCLAPVELHGA